MSGRVTEHVLSRAKYLEWQYGTSALTDEQKFGHAIADEVVATIKAGDAPVHLLLAGLESVGSSSAPFAAYLARVQQLLAEALRGAA